MLRKPSSWAAAGLVLFVYVAVLGLMPKGAFWSPDEGAKYIQLQTIRWDGGLKYSIPYPASTTDPDFKFYPTRCRHEDVYPVPIGDKVRFHWPLWFSLIGRLSFSLFGLTGLYLVPLVSGWLIAVLSGYLMRYHDARLAPLTIVLVGFATPVFFYSLTFWEHTLATLCGIGALCVLVASRAHGASALALTVSLLLAAVVLRVEMLAFAAAVVGTWFISRRLPNDQPGDKTAANARGLSRSHLPVIALSAAFTVVLLAVLLGSLNWRHRWLFSALPRYLLGNVDKLPFLPDVLVSVFINSTGQQGPPIASHWSLAALGAFGAAAVAPFVRVRSVETMLILSGLLLALQFSLFLVFLPQPYISLHGVLPITPYIVFGVYALPHAWRQRRDSLLAIAAATVLYLLLGFAVIYTFAIEPNGAYRTGLEWGARYMLTLYPLAVILSVIALQAYRRSQRHAMLKNGLTVIVAAMMLVAVQFQVRGLQMLHQSRQLVSTWEQALPQDEPVVTDVWWLPAAMAPFFTTHEMLCVRQPDQISEWLPVAAGHGIDTFTFASLQPVDAAQLAAAAVEISPVEDRIVSGLHVSRFRIAAADGS